MSVGDLVLVFKNEWLAIVFSGYDGHHIVNGEPSAAFTNCDLSMN